MMLAVALMLQAVVVGPEVPAEFRGFYVGDQKMCTRVGRFGFVLTASTLGNGITEARVVAVRALSDHAIEITSYHDGDRKPIVQVVSRDLSGNVSVTIPDIVAAFPHSPDAGVFRFVKCPS